MAKQKTKSKKTSKSKQENDFASSLISSLNSEFASKGERIAYNLSTDTSPTHVGRWISTGSKLLDYIVSNKRDGGLPEGRIVEIYGPPSIGKSHIAIQIATSTQKSGGIVVYFDTENATSIENLEALGVDISSKFVYIDTHCTEDVLAIAESTIIKAKNLDKDVPITIIWDSVAATSPKAELEGDYDKDSIGLQARAISKGMRKITGVIAGQRVLFVCLNQIRVKIGVLYGNPMTVPGGNAIPFHSSVRIELGAGQHIKDDDGNVIGINVSAKTIKNKIAPPFRKCNFEIHFGKGIKESEQIFDILRTNGPEVINGKTLEVHGAGSWKYFEVTSEDGEVLVDEKFYKKDFEKLLKKESTKSYLEDLIEVVMVKKMLNKDSFDFDPESYEEAKALVALTETEFSADPELNDN